MAQQGETATVKKRVNRPRPPVFTLGDISDDDSDNSEDTVDTSIHSSGYDGRYRAAKKAESFPDLGVLIGRGKQSVNQNEPPRKFHLRMSNHPEWRAKRAGKGKKTKKGDDPRNNPGRYPAGDTSIDLASINLALGTDINGNQPMSIDASHGAVPSFISDPSRPLASDTATAGDSRIGLVRRQEVAAAASFSTEPPLAAGPSSYSSAARPFHLGASAVPSSAPSSAFARSADLGNSFANDPAFDRRTSLASGFDTPTQASDSSAATQRPTADGYKRISDSFRDRFRKGAASTSHIESIASGFGSGGVPMQRSSSASSMAQQQGNGNSANGNGAQISGLGGQAPFNAGQQMDIHYVYQKMLELSQQLQENRVQTQGIIEGAEELATRAATSGEIPNIKDTDNEIAAGRIAALTKQVNDLTKVKSILLREQRENTKLIGEYETAMGNLTELVRNHSYNKDMQGHAAARAANQALQDEKDSHLATRLERDEWMNTAVRYGGMIREAYRLRCEEEILPITIVTGLQNEVRGYRNALGMEPEKFEDEFGYPVLKHVVNGAGEP